MDEPKHTVPELSRRTNVSEPTIRRLCEEGRIRAVKIGNQWRIPQSEMERVIREGTR